MKRKMISLLFAMACSTAHGQECVAPAVAQSLLNQVSEKVAQVAKAEGVVAALQTELAKAQARIKELEPKAVEKK